LKDALQSDLDTLIGKFDLNLKDCSLVRKTGVLGETTVPFTVSGPIPKSDIATHSSIKKLLAISYKAC
jgi:hypothetical protein